MFCRLQSGGLGTRWPTSLRGRCPGNGLDAWNVRRASIADEYPDLACAPHREIFGKRRPAVFEFYVVRSKARSSESMFGPC